MKQFLESIYKSLYGIDIVKPHLCPVVEKPEKTNSEKLYDFALTFYNTDPTPKDEINDEVACAEVVSTILNKYLKDFPIITFTPDLLNYLKKDIRFKEVTEFKTGVIILSPTGFTTGHVGIIGKLGKILSNSSSLGIFTDKFDCVSWINKYSKLGQLDLHIFELV